MQYFSFIKINEKVILYIGISFSYSNSIRFLNYVIHLNFTEITYEDSIFIAHDDK